MKNKIYIGIIVFFAIVFVSIDVYAGMIENNFYGKNLNLGNTSPYRIIKRVDGFILPVTSTDTLGSSTISGYFNTATATTDFCLTSGICLTTAAGSFPDYLSQVGDVSTLTLASGYTLAYTGASEWQSTSTIFVKADGNVGIGTTDPSAKLHVAQTSTTGNTGWFYRNLASSSTNAPLMFLKQDNAGDDQGALNIQNDGAGNGIFIDQNGDGKGLSIDTEAITSTNYGLYISSTGGARSVNIEQNADAVGVLIDKKGSGGQNALYLINAGTGNGIFIDQNGDGKGLLIDSESTSNVNYGFQLQQAGGARAAHIQQNSDNINLYLEKTSSGVGEVLYIGNAGTGDNVFIDQNGNGRALHIDSEATTTNVFSLNAANTDGNVVSWTFAGNHQDSSNLNFLLDSTNANSIVRNALIRHQGAGINTTIQSTVAGAGEVLQVIQDSASASANAMSIQNDGTGIGLLIDGSGTGYSAIFNNGNVGIGTTSPAYELDVNGDIQSDNYYGDISDTTLNTMTLSGATLTTLQDFIKINMSAGKISGGTISDNGNGTVAITEINGVIRTTASELGILKSFTLSSQASVGISENEVNYIYVDYNGGTLQIATTSDRSTINHYDEVGVGRVYNDGSEIHTLAGGVQVQDFSYRNHKMNVEKDGFIRTSGMVISEVGNRGLAMTAGVFYSGNTRFTASASTTMNWSTWWNDGAWQSSTGSTTINNTQYNDYGTGLADLSNNQYGVHFVYRDYDGHFNSVFGIGSYTLAEAQALGTPANLPDIVSEFSVLLGKIIVKKSGTNFTQIETPWDTQFSGQTVTDHGSLGGLLDDDHTQYGTLAGNESITGNWVNTDNPWADNEVADDITASNYLALTAWYATTTHALISSLPSLTTVGTIGTGVWQGTDVGVEHGGTGVSTLTDGGLLLGSGTGAISTMAVLNNGGIVVGDGTTDPVALAAFTAYDGDLRHEAGGLEADVSSYSGLIAISGGSTSEVDAKSELEAQIADVADFAEADGDVWTGVHDAGGATSFEIPNGAGNTVDADGEIAHDTTDDQLIIGADADVIQTKVRIWGATIASTSPAFINAGLIAIPVDLDGYTMTEIRCKVDGGTNKVIAVEDASANSTEDITCLAAVTSDDGSITNAAVTAAEEMYIDLGATNGAVNYVSISVFGNWTRE